MAKYNPEIVKQICAELEEGMTQKDTANLCGIDEATFYRWLNSKRKFRKSVQLAESNYIKKHTQILNVKSAREPTGARALDILARRRPNEWGDKTKIQIGGDKENPLEVKQTLDDTQKSIISTSVTEAVKKAFGSTK